MKIAFSISSPVGGAIPKLIAEVSSFKCRVQVDLNNGTVVASDVDPLRIENIIEVVENCFEITGVDIDTTDVVFEVEKPAVEEKTKTESKVDKTALEADSADDLSFKKIEFQNNDVEKQMNKLLKIIYWMMYKENVPADEIVKHLLTTGTEIAMRFNPKPSISVNVGDIVDCQYGTYLDSEISGGHVHALVCNIVNNTVFVIPITKQIIEGQFYLPFSGEKDVVYTEPDKYNEGTLLLDRGSYVGIERLHEVIGKALPEFFDEVIEVLPEAYCFESLTSTDTSYDGEAVEDFEPEDTTTADTVVDNETGVDSISEDVENISESATITESTETEPVSDTATKDFSKFENVEDALAKLIGESVQTLDKNSDLEPQLDDFLTTIGISNEILIKQAFLAACKVKKVKYESILIELKNQNPEQKEDEIKQALKDAFKTRISTNYPTITEQFPKISIMSLLKFFAKSFK